MDRLVGHELPKLSKLTIIQRVRHMCVAGTRAESSNDRDSHEQKRYRSFLFQFATLFMHELGHMFVTFLGLGEKGTPPPMKGDLRGTGKEAGAHLETIIFGGVLFPMYNPDEGEDQHHQACSYPPALNVKSSIWADNL